MFRHLRALERRAATSSGQPPGTTSRVSATTNERSSDEGNTARPVIPEGPLLGSVASDQSVEHQQIRSSCLSQCSSVLLIQLQYPNLWLLGP